MVIFQFQKHMEPLELLYINICNSYDYWTINIAFQVIS